MDKQQYIEKIIKSEWEMFDKVNNKGGRVSCQDNYPTFRIMRKAQFDAWNEDMLAGYLNDLEEAEQQGRNLLTEKYAFMMEYTFPEEYENIRAMLPEISESKNADIEEIARIYMEQTEQFAAEYPQYMLRARPVHSKDDKSFTSIETYLKCELKTYSDYTISEYLKYLKELEIQGKKIVYMIFENTVHAYGYASVAEAERNM